MYREFHWVQEEYNCLGTHTEDEMSPDYKALTLPVTVRRNIYGNKEETVTLNPVTVPVCGHCF
jgi:hypothetical protein